LATVMARAGRSVMVLERETVYRDRVRGEWLAPWGVAEARRLGLYPVLVAAGGHHVARFGQWDENTDPDKAQVLDLGAFVEGVPGPLCFGHPEASQALVDAAAAAGAVVVKGARVGQVGVGASPGVTYTTATGDGGGEHAVSAKLVVGADGRQSMVRRAMGVDMHRLAAGHLLAGLLVDGAGDWPADTQAIGTHGDVMFLVFPRQAGRVRVYLAHALEDRNRFAGPDGASAFLSTFPLESLPASQALADARPAGPCVSQPCDDTWMDQPFVAGAVLVGDAAGYNNPLTGQGLSITLRDVRIVTDLLTAGDDWSPAAFASYGVERVERMRRLRFFSSIMASLGAEFGAEAARRRRRALRRVHAHPTLSRLWATPMAGPDEIPAEAFTEATLSLLVGGVRPRAV